MGRQKIVQFENVSELKKAFVLEVDSVEELHNQLEIIFPLLQEKRDRIRVLVSASKEGTLNRIFLNSGPIPPSVSDLYVKLQRKESL